jgi:hypothetical protein
MPRRNASGAQRWGGKSWKKLREKFSLSRVLYCPEQALHLFLRHLYLGQMETDFQAGLKESFKLMSVMAF